MPLMLVRNYATEWGECKRNVTKYCLITFQESKAKYVGFEALTAVIMKSTLFSRALLATWFHVGFFVGLFFNPEYEGGCSSVTLVDFQRTTLLFVI
jgi:hypothetical protein